MAGTGNLFSELEVDHYDASNATDPLSARISLYRNFLALLNSLDVRLTGFVA